MKTSNNNNNDNNKFNLIDRSIGRILYLVLITFLKYQDFHFRNLLLKL